MDWIEVTARTVDDAKELALDRLGVVEDELEYQIVDEARSGLFGIGRTDARIRARVKPLSREKPNERRRRRGPNERSRTRGSRVQGEHGQSTAAEKTASGNGVDRGSRGAGGSGASRRRRGGRGRGSSAAVGDAAPAVTTVAEDASGAEVEVDQGVPVGMQATKASEFTEDLVRAMGFSARVRADIEDEDVTVHIEGDDLGPLVGPRGATLQALEEVVRAVVQHHAGGRSAWVHVDVNRYRERRREALADFARKVAGEVMEARTPRVLEPMGAADRKVVHDTLADLDGVTTASEGEDPRRRVVIQPA